MTCFVLTDPQGQIKDRDMLDLYDGYLELCQPTKFFKEFEVFANKELIGRNDVFCGHVSICRQIWKNLGIKEPEVDCYPKELKEYFGRTIKMMKFFECLNLFKVNDECGLYNAYFVKPIKNKLFTGKVFESYKELDKLRDISPCSSNTLVYVSSFVKFDAEFRAYIYKNKIVDVFRYWGDNWSITVDKPKVEHMVSLVKDAPIFYSLDFGINSWGRTLLIEINDGYALGNYGLGPKQYAEMSMARWKEIMQ